MTNFHDPFGETSPSADKSQLPSRPIRQSFVAKILENMGYDQQPVYQEEIDHQGMTPITSEAAQQLAQDINQAKQQPLAEIIPINTHPRHVALNIVRTV